MKTKKSNKAYVIPGDTVYHRLPHSEVCMHMRVAGEKRKVRIESRGSNPPVAQILNEDDSPFSAPILMGEAGFYASEQAGVYYCYLD